MRRHSHAGLVLVVVFASARARAETPPRVEVDHEKNVPQFVEATAKGDQYIMLVVHNSCREFPAGVKGAVKPDTKTRSLEDNRLLGLSDLGACLVRDVEIPIPHLERYGGYLVTIRPGELIAVRPNEARTTEAELFSAIVAQTCKKANDDSDECRTNPQKGLRATFQDDSAEILTAANARVVPLEELTVTIAVRQSGPLLVDFAGGFTSSFLTDPVYGLEAQPAAIGTGTETVVVQNHAAEDRVRLGVAAFVHVASTKVLAGVPAVSFGLGVSNGGQVDYFFGLGLRAFGQAFLSVGAHMGRVRRLPDGVELGKPVADQNVLANLPYKTTASFFFGLSYSFIGNARDVLGKPFKTVSEEPVPKP